MIFATIIVALVAILHFYFLILEMFLWTKPQGLKAFNKTPEFAAITKILAANQGLYNGFLGAGLVWAVLNPDPYTAFQTKLFFLTCVIIAGVYGALTFSRKILYIQALPALAALILTLIFR